MKALAKRDDVSPALTWNLDDLYPSDAAWEEDFAAIAAHLPDITALRGALGQSAAALVHALHIRDDISQRMGRLSAYARLRFDEDTKRSRYQALLDRVTTLATQFHTLLAFFTPEILAIPPTTLDTWVRDDVDLAVYQHELADITRERAHIRSDEIESVLASAGEVAQGPSRIFGMLANADLRLPSIADASNNEARLTQGNYLSFMQDPVRRVRHDAFTGMHATFKAQQNTLAALYGSHIKQRVFYARQRGYPTTLQATLDGNNIPADVYTNLIATVRQGLPVLHRYIRLRQRILGLDEPHMYDLYAPLVPERQITVTFDEAREQVIAALAPLGTDYVGTLRHGLTSRWVDVPENEGKRSGAYSLGVYGVHPFVLLNYQSQLNDVFTLAHELGHSLHSHYSFAAQPYPYAHYTIFIAEIASTFNEALLTRHLLQTASDNAVRAHILNDYLDSFRSTLFRQAMFADFEMQAHARAEAGEALTPELLCAIYQNLNVEYYGAGGVTVDDLSAWEWSRIPHFYRSFYVYQYATGIAAATAMAQAVLTEGQPAVARYLMLLRSGSSDYPIALLQRAGVDMTTPAPITAAIAEFDRAIGEMEELLIP